MLDKRKKNVKEEKVEILVSYHFLIKIFGRVKLKELQGN